MWMNDIEYEFIKDSQEKKVTARSARSTRTHCGKSGAVRLPSDNLTKKELKAMSGEVIEYASLCKPMSWQDFRALPNDLKKQYVGYIREKFGAPDKYIAEMFGVSCPTLSMYLIDAGVTTGNKSNGAKKWAKQNFYAWRSGATEGAVAAEEIEPEETPVENTPVEPVVTAGEPTVSKPNPVPVSGALGFSGVDIDSILPVLQTLLSGTKLNFHVSWTIEGAE